MSPYWPHIDGSHAGSSDSNQDFDDAEKGLHVNTKSLPSLADVDQKTEIPSRGFLSPISPIAEGITPSSSVPVLSLPLPEEKPVAHAPVPTVSAARRRWILFLLWFNTYRKFFMFVTLLNLVGIIMAALHRFPYAQNHLGALVLGNLLCAILMRNELFLRILYIIAIYGLRSVHLSCPRSQEER